MINEGTFELCTSLTNVNIPNSVKSIGDSAFAKCYSLTSITIPDSVTEIGEGAFNECAKLKSVIYKGKTYDYKHIADLYSAING